MKQSPPPATSWYRQDIAVAVLLAAGCVAIFARACWNDFVNYDNFAYITQNANVRAGLTGKSVLWALTANEQSNWHPLTWLSLEVDSQLFGLRAWGFHLTNLLLHTANTVLLFAVFRRMTGALWRSALVAAFFGLHPLHVESVAWAAERKDVLSTFFWLLTMAAYARYVAKPGASPYLAMIVLFALGLTAKPMLVTLPFVLLLLDYWPLGRLRLETPHPNPSPPVRGRGAPGTPLAKGERGRGEGARAGSSDSPLRKGERGGGEGNRVLPLLLEKAPLFLLAILSSIVTFWAQHTGGAVSSLNQQPLVLRLETAVVGYAGYLFKMVWPTRLAPFYPLPAYHFPTWEIVTAVILLLGVTGLALALARRRAYLLVGWCWYLGTLVPVIGLVQVGLQASADRYTYIPLIGIFLAIVWAAADIVAYFHVPASVAAAAAGLPLAACALLTEVQLGHWHDTPTLWYHTIAAVPDSYVAYNNLGYYFAGEDDESSHAQAKEFFEASLRVSPNFPDAKNNLGRSLAREGRLQEAIKFYSEALALNPRFAQVHNNLGLALARVGRLDEAADHFRQAFTIRPTYSMAHNNLGKLLAQQGQIREAQAELEEALRLNPENADALANLGVLLQRAGDAQGALERFQTAIRLEPKNADAHNNLGMLFAAEGKRDMAFDQFTEAVQLNPRLASAHYNLGVALAEQGKRPEAIDHYAEAVRLEPADVPSRNNLGWELLRAGRWDQAMTHLEELVRLAPEFALAHDNLGIVLAILGKSDQALHHFQEAVRLQPAFAQFHCDLALALLERGDEKAARPHFDEALRREPSWPQRSDATARELASDPDGRARNGALALRLAKEVCAATNNQKAAYLDTLAACYAELGRFAEARAAAQRALAVAARDASADAAGIQSRLHLYENDAPFRRQ
jgi:tetratricopeptide (TPR) repeat protein